jgi:thiol:disulfide interchange protein DsbC
MRIQGKLGVIVMVVGLMGMASFAIASPSKVHGQNSCIECHSLTKQESDAMIKDFQAHTVSIKAHPAGMFEILVEGDNPQYKGNKGVFFIPFSKKFLIGGQVFDVKAKKPVLMHEDQLPKPPKPITHVDLKKAPLSNAVTIGNDAAKKHLYVFTDPDCPYCRQLHPILNRLVEIEPNVAVHIMLMPIPQLHPKAYDKARAIISSKSKQILDDAFAGKPVPEIGGEGFKKEIDAIMKFSREAGINGTPFVILGDGSVYNGPRTPEEIKKALK